MAFTIKANIAAGDETTAPENLIFKIYNNGVLYYTTGSSSSDADVSILGSVVTIINVPITGFEEFTLTIAQVDEANNESIASNEKYISVISFYEEGFYAPGFFP